MNRFAMTMAAAVLATTLLSQAQVVRDPFLDLSAKEPMATTTRVKQPQRSVPTHTEPDPVKPTWEAPVIDVQGILTSTPQPQAILKGPTMTFLVKEGDKLGDYRVIHIDRGGVTFAFKKIKFRCLLDNPQ